MHFRAHMAKVRNEQRRTSHGAVVNAPSRFNPTGKTNPKPKPRAPQYIQEQMAATKAARVERQANGFSGIPPELAPFIAASLVDAARRRKVTA